MGRGRPEVNARPGSALAVAVTSPLADATVLVVDDHGSNVTLLEHVLRAAGVTEVHSVTDSRQVVKCCLELEPDLVLLDLHMPHLDGYEVLAALREALPADVYLPVLVLTSDAT